METSTTAIDPVCGMTVDPGTARRTSEHQGTTIYFCSPSCKKAFDAEPSLYISEVGDASVAPSGISGGCACCKIQARRP
jgi:Cu+-exporting ATPase